MQDEAVARTSPSQFHITTAGEFRAALRRIRDLDPATRNSAAARERAALEIAIARYLAHDESWASAAPESGIAAADRHNSATPSSNV